MNNFKRVQKVSGWIAFVSVALSVLSLLALSFVSLDQVSSGFGMLSTMTHSLTELPFKHHDVPTATTETGRAKGTQNDPENNYSRGSANSIQPASAISDIGSLLTCFISVIALFVNCRSKKKEIIYNEERHQLEVEKLKLEISMLKKQVDSSV